MNTGLQDAYNLAWKLALVIARRADPALLDSYEAERLPVAERLLGTTDRAFMLIVKDTWFARLFRTKLLARMAALAMTRERIRKFAFGTISQIGIRYRASPLSRTLPGLPDGAPRAGDRFPWLQLRLHQDGMVEDLFNKLDDMRFHLLAIGQPVPSDFAVSLNNMLQIHQLADDTHNRSELARAHIAGPAFYLLRPDGHVALAGTRIDGDELSRYLRECHLLIDETVAHSALSISHAV